MDFHSVYTHWLPRVTICPINGFPDFIYIEVTIPGNFNKVFDLYEARKIIQRIVPFGRRIYMEEIAREISNAFPNATVVVVRLALNRHKVIVQKTGILS